MARGQPLLLAVICVILAAPLLLVDLPPLLDYPNHLARLFVAAQGADDPLMAQMFTAKWAIIPNLAVDLIAPPLFRLFPVHVAGRIIIAVAVLLPVLGTVAFHRAVFNQRSWWPLASALVAYNAALLLGFLNFIIALGLALLLAAAWIAGRKTRPVGTLVLVFFGTILLFFCHLMGLAFFAVLIGMYEAEQAWKDKAGRHGGLWRRGLAVAAVLVVPSALFLASPFQQAEGELGWLPLNQKLVQLIFPFLNYSFPLDVATGLMVIGFAMLCLMARWGVLRLHCAAAIALLGLLCAVAPFAFKGTMALDSRFAIMVGFLTFAGMSPEQLPRRVAAFAIPGMAGLFVLRMAILALAWHGHQADVTELRAVIASVPPGSTVAVATVTPSEAPDYWRHAPLGRMLSDGSMLDAHMAALLLIERRAFWPFLFAEPSQQPIALRPDYQRLADQTGGMRPHLMLGQGICGYDFLLLLDAGGEPDLAAYGAERMDLVAALDAAALFRVRPCSYLSSTPSSNAHSSALAPAKAWIRDSSPASDSAGPS